MSPSFQLSIPKPCHERWENMQPTGKGRRCASCQKNVIDFTAMSDQELIRHLSTAGSTVCGRLLPDQLHRKLSPAPEATKRQGSGWPWVIAGIMLASDQRPPSPLKLPGANMAARKTGEQIATVSQSEYTIGKPVFDSPGESKAYTIMDVERSVTMGMPAIKIVDSILSDSTEQPRDSFPKPAAISETDIADQYPFTGGITMEGPIQDPTPGDTILDTLKKWAVDTLTTLSILPQKQWVAYPNPVRPGGVLHLSWQSDAGIYKLELYSLSGVLLQAKMLEIASAGQQDEWTLPATTNPGIYLIRSTRQDRKSVFSQKIIVE